VEKNILKNVIIAILTIAIIVIFVIIYKNSRYVFKDENKKYEQNYFVEYSEDGNAGVINRKGEEVIHTVYSEITIPNPEKDVFICSIDEEKSEIINSKGEKLFENYNNVSALVTSDGNQEYEKEVLKFEKDGRYGLIDFSGNVVVEPEYESILSLKVNPGKLLVKKDGDFGVVDSKGNLVIPTEYNNISGDNYSTEEDGYTKTGYIVKKKTDEGIFAGYISAKGKMLLKPEYEMVQRISNYEDKDNIYLIEMKDGKKGVYKNKKQIIENNYQTITYSSSSNIIIAKTTKNNEFYKLDGRKILNKKYENYTLAGKYILVEEKDSKQLYDTNGNYISNFSYKSIQDAANSNYFITIDENDHYSIMNKSTVIKDNYIDLKYAYGDYFIFTNEENKVGVLNVWTGVVVEPIYDSILKIYNINALEARRENETDIYSSKMTKVSTISDAIVENVKEKYAVIYSNTQKLYIDENGNEISNIKIFDNKLYSKVQDGKWGFQDKSGNIVVECNYDMVTELNEYGFAGIMLDGKWGVIDESGNVVLEPNYEIESYYFPSFIGKTYLVVNEVVQCIKLGE